MRIYKHWLEQEEPRTILFNLANFDGIPKDCKLLG